MAGECVRAHYARRGHGLGAMDASLVGLLLPRDPPTTSSLITSSTAPSTASSPASSWPSSLSLPSSSLRYFLLLFLSELARFFFFTPPTMEERAVSPLRSSSRRWARMLRAMARFWERERVAWDLTTMPVGRCFNWTAEFVLFCCIWEEKKGCVSHGWSARTESEWS